MHEPVDHSPVRIYPETNRKATEPLFTLRGFIGAMLFCGAILAAHAVYYWSCILLGLTP